MTIYLSTKYTDLRETRIKAIISNVLPHDVYMERQYMRSIIYYSRFKSYHVAATNKFALYTPRSYSGHMFRTKHEASRTYALDAFSLL